MTTPGKPAFGGTVLRLPAIQSPNYVAGVSGWAIFQNGTVEFNSGTFRGTVTAGEFDGTNFVINANGEFFYSGAPALGNLTASIAPTAGTDAQGNAYIGGIVIYANVGASGYEAMQYGADGLRRYTSPLPGGAAGPYSAGDLIRLDATGILLNSAATIVSGTTQFDGTITLSNGGSSTISIASDNGHPLFSKEIELTGEATPTTPGTAGNVKAYANNATGEGHLKYKSGDSVDYATGSVRAQAAGQTVSSITFVNLTGLSLSLGIGTYFFRCRVFIQAASSAGQWQVEITAPGGTTGINYSFKYESAAGVMALNVNRTAFSAAQGGPNPMVAGAYWITLEGFFTLTVAGSIVVKGLTTVGADTWDVEAGSYIEAFPIV